MQQLRTVTLELALVARVVFPTALSSLAGNASEGKEQFRHAIFSAEMGTLMGRRTCFQKKSVIRGVEEERDAIQTARFEKDGSAQMFKAFLRLATYNVETGSMTEETIFSSQNSVI